MIPPNAKENRKGLEGAKGSVLESGKVVSYNYEGRVANSLRIGLEKVVLRK
jgi:hypothetical protein